MTTLEGNQRKCQIKSCTCNSLRRNVVTLNQPPEPKVAGSNPAGRANSPRLCPGGFAPLCRECAVLLGKIRAFSASSLKSLLISHAMDVGRCGAWWDVLGDRIVQCCSRFHTGSLRSISR